MPDWLHDALTTQMRANSDRARRLVGGAPVPGDDRTDLGAGARGVEKSFPHEFCAVLRWAMTGRSVRQIRFERVGHH